MHLTGFLRLFQSSRVRLFVLALLGILAAISAGQGAWNAIHRSQDFQWSGAHMLLHRIDPWAEILAGDPNHLIHEQQNPNYLPILYILIAPFGLLSPVAAQILWLPCNLAFAILSAILAARFYGLGSRSSTFAVVCLLLMATPTRNSIGNGQQGLFILFLWCLTLLSARLTDTRAAWSGLSYFKFNFAPALCLYLFIRRGLRAVAWSAVPSILATITLWLWLGGIGHPGYLLRLVREPFTVSRIGYYPSGSDMNLMDVLESLLNHLHTPEAIVKAVTLGAAVLICAIVLYLAIHRHRFGSTQWQMALMATMSFCLFKHHSYDSVVLLLPLCYTLRLWRDTRAQIAILLIGYLWYFQRLVDATHIALPGFFVAQFAMLMVVLLMVYRLRPVEERTEPGWQSTPHQA
jgi:hypothetical protein